MNRRLVTALMAVLILLTMVACKKKTEETQPLETTVEATEPMIPGAAENVIAEEDFESPDETSAENKAAEDTEDSATEDIPETTFVETEAVEETTAQETEGKEEPVQDTTLTEYEAYNAMTGAEQKEFVDSFASIEDFFEWYNDAKAEYDALHPEIEIKDGVIDLGEIGGNP